MGYLAAGKCVATLPAALQADCAQYRKSSFSADGCVEWLWQCTAAGSVAMSMNRSSIATVAATGCAAKTATSVNFTSTPVYAACDALQPYSDLTALWLLGIAAAAVVWATKKFILRNVMANQ